MTPETFTVPLNLEVDTPADRFDHKLLGMLRLWEGESFSFNGVRCVKRWGRAWRDNAFSRLLASALPRKAAKL